MADRPETAPSLGLLADDLPLYVLEDEREARHRLRSLGVAVRGQWRALSSSAPAGGWWPSSQRQPLVPTSMPVMLVITRVIELSPPSTLDAFEQWWQEQQGSVELAVGPDRLEVERPARSGSSSVCLMRVRTRLRRPSRWSPPQRLDLEILSWSASRTELDLRPVGPVRRTHHFFAIGHELLAAVAQELSVRVPEGATPETSACPP